MPGPNYLKVNADVAISEGRIGIGILIRDHLGIHLFGKATQQKGAEMWNTVNF